MILELLLIVPFMLFVLPLSIYLCVQMGVYGFLRAVWNYEQFKEHSNENAK